MAISNYLLSHTSENLVRFSIQYIFVKLSTKPRNF